MLSGVNDVANEPVLGYAPGSPERTELRREIALQIAAPASIAPQIGGERRQTGAPALIRAPHRHALVIGEAFQASREDARAAIESALAARTSWANTDFESRAAIFSRAAELLAGRFRQRLNAATLLGQSKTPHQAEIDSACELVDFLRFNVHFARQIHESPLLSAVGESNRYDFRPLEGFVYAVTPFNFTAIAGNLPTAPALLGNVVVWKPSPHALLSAHHVLALLREAGLPDGVINFVPGDAATITDQVLSHPELAGLNFTGSTAVFRSLFQKVAERLDRYRSYPRLVGETGGKDFVVAHASADLDALAVGVARGAFEYQGQKCSAASRLYVPRSLAGPLEAKLIEILADFKVGDPADFSCFMGAVIARHAYDRIQGAIERARADPGCRIVFGGDANDAEGFFIEPTVIAVSDPGHALFTDEIFGPVLALYVYDDDRYDEVLGICDRSPYALTGAIFARDRAAIDLAKVRLRDAAGNFYVNDKPTGAVVGQQPFGGARWSGTNDKAGSAAYLLRWLSPRVIKENFRSPRDYRYPHLEQDPADDS
jgi:1-pyrroline-5-carboxylate dehydrogenase